MKKAIVLLLIFIGYQFMVALIFVALNVLHGEAVPNELDGSALSLSSFISSLLIIAHLIYCRNVRFGWRPHTEVPAKWLLLCLPPVLSAMYLLNGLSELFPLPDWNEETFAAMSDNVYGVAAIILLAPLAEELLFRGAIEGHFLKQGKHPLFAIGVSSLLFGTIHGNPAQIPFAFLLGLLIGWIFYRTGSVVPGVICHVINNGLAVITMHFYPEEESLWDAGNVLPMTLAAVIFAVSFYFSRKYFPHYPWQEVD